MSSLAVAMSSSSSSMWPVNFRSMILGKCSTRRSVTIIPRSVAKNRRSFCST